VRANLATELARIDANVSSRLAASGYTAPANSDIAAIKLKTDKLDFNAQNHVAANVHQVQAAAITSIQDGLALEATSQSIRAKTDTLVNTDVSSIPAAVRAQLPEVGLIPALL
jgi:hypothetical protein